MPLIDLRLPDGSRYIELIVAEDSTLNDIQIDLDKLLDSPSDIQKRLLIPLGHSVEEVKNYLSDTGCYLVPRKTQHFTLNSQARQHLIDSRAELQWDSYGSEFRVSPVILNDDREVLMTAMVESFGVTFTGSSLEKIVTNQSKLNKITTHFSSPTFSTSSCEVVSYLVWSKTSDENQIPVGAFSFAISAKNDLNEIQLHSVAGRFGDIESYQGENKFTIIMAAVLYELNRSYPQSMLSFTCSKPKVVAKYEQCGFLKDDKRVCFVLEKKTD